MSDATNPSLSELTTRLEAIVRALEEDPMELDGAIELFQEAVGHLRKAESVLDAAELKIDELVGRGEGARLEAFDEDED